jgi:glutamine amidotransferase
MTVLVVDYGMGNLASVRRALEECGARVVTSADPRDIISAERLVIPGVGAFGLAMERLSSQGWIRPIKEAVLGQGVPLLGICLGMQLLATESDEFGLTPGLDLIPGRVQRLVPTHADERVPHVGWNEVTATKSSALFDGIAPATDFYFVHSYHYVARQPETVLATTPYCGTITAAVGLAHVFGAQFHPEKSSKAGLRMLRNFLELRPA